MCAEPAGCNTTNACNMTQTEVTMAKDIGVANHLTCSTSGQYDGRVPRVPSLVGSSCVKTQIIFPPNRLAESLHG